jgi:enamine deaminase RidA (YjgF/YER057c/UK114 family)
MSLPALPFSKTRRAGGLVFLSGELPLLPDGSVPQGIGPQTDLALEKIAATLTGQGLSMADVISCTVYLADKADFRAFNEAYARHFSDPLPVRTTVQAELMLDAKIEITVIAQERAGGGE